MLKKIIALALVIMGLVGIMIPAAMAENTNVRKYASPVTMYVKSQNGGPLNVRTAPVITKTNCIGQINYGKAVKVIGTAASSSDWVAISFNNRTAFVMVQYLSSVKPTKAETEQAYITHQMNHFKVITNRFAVIAHPENPATGWVNFRQKRDHQAHRRPRPYRDRRDPRMVPGHRLRDRQDRFREQGVCDKVNSLNIKSPEKGLFLLRSCWL